MSVMIEIKVLKSPMKLPCVSMLCVKGDVSSRFLPNMIKNKAGIVFKSWIILKHHMLLLNMRFKIWCL